MSQIVLSPDHGPVGTFVTMTVTGDPPEGGYGAAVSVKATYAGGGGGDFFYPGVTPDGSNGCTFVIADETTGVVGDSITFHAEVKDALDNTWFPEPTGQSFTIEIEDEVWWHQPETDQWRWQADSPGEDWEEDDIPALTVTEVIPTHAGQTGGQPVTIVGTGFGDDELGFGHGVTVTLKGIPVTVTSVPDSTHIYGNIGQSPTTGLGDCVVTIPDGSMATGVDLFTYDASVASWYLVSHVEHVNGDDVIVPDELVEVEFDEDPPEPDLGQTVTLLVEEGAEPAYSWWRWPDMNIWVYSPMSPGTQFSASSQPGLKGWYRSIEEFAGGAMLVVAGVPKDPRTWDELTAYATGTAFAQGGAPGGAVSYNGRMVFAMGGYNLGTDQPPIGVFDGLSSRILTRIPATVAGATPKAIMSMVAANGKIYVATFDTGTSAANWTGRVFELDPLAAQLSIVGAADTFVSGQMPYCLAFHNGFLYCGTNPGDGTTAGKVYRIRLGVDTVWTLDRTLSSDSVAGATSMVGFGGKLYVGTSAAALSSAKVLVRSETGAWSTSYTGPSTTVNNFIPALAEFRGVLFATYYDSTTPTSRIVKFESGSWSTAYAAASALRVPYVALFVGAGTMFAIGGGAAVDIKLLRTEDGIVFTDSTAFLPGSPTDGIPMFCEVRA